MAKTHFLSRVSQRVRPGNLIAQAISKRHKNLKNTPYVKKYVEQYRKRNKLGPKSSPFPVVRSRYSTKLKKYVGHPVAIYPSESEYNKTPITVKGKKRKSLLYGAVGSKNLKCWDAAAALAKGVFHVAHLRKGSKAMKYAKEQYNKMKLTRVS